MTTPPFTDLFTEPHASSYDDVPALGTVVEEGRGDLPFHLIHGEALVACASWALGSAGITAVDLGTQWAGVVASGEAFVLHDPLCPMTPASFIADCLARSLELDSVVVGVRPVTDTVKRIGDGLIGETLDRSRMHAVVSPVVLPPSVVAALDHLPSPDFADLVVALAQRFPVELVTAPPEARRVSDDADIRVLEALTQP